ncbi:hypothetical protein ACFWBR_14455 [Streptomyces sp. NPDC060006]|nr:hypothetical protein [Streptomyces aurantiacus]WAU85844.1 hypothetical protein O1Q96_42770 [Streptomyces aurantiacus]
MSFHKVAPVKKTRKAAPAARKQSPAPAPKHGAKKQRRRPVGKK